MEHFQVSFATVCRCHIVKHPIVRRQELTHGPPGNTTSSSPPCQRWEEADQNSGRAVAYGLRHTGRPLANRLSNSVGRSCAALRAPQVPSASIEPVRGPYCGQLAAVRVQEGGSGATSNPDPKKSTAKTRRAPRSDARNRGCGGGISRPPSGCLASPDPRCRFPHPWRPWRLGGSTVFSD